MKHGEQGGFSRVVRALLPVIPVSVSNAVDHYPLILVKLAARE
jgi:hypothetical protein